MPVFEVEVTYSVSSRYYVKADSREHAAEMVYEEGERSGAFNPEDDFDAYWDWQDEDITEVTNPSEHVLKQIEFDWETPPEPETEGPYSKGLQDESLFELLDVLPVDAAHEV